MSFNVTLITDDGYYCSAATLITDDSSYVTLVTDDGYYRSTVTLRN